MEVYYKLSSGFTEPVCQEALQIEFGLRKIPFEAQKRLRMEYKGFEKEKGHVADFLCYDSIIVEIKSLAHLTQREWSQVVNYLKVTNMRLGLLINFGSAGHLEHRRVIV